MEKKHILIGIVTIAIGFTAFGFMHKSQEVPVTGLNVSKTSVKETNTENFYANDNLSALDPDTKLKVSFSINSENRRSITLQTIAKAKLMSDLMAHYPSNWISDYVSVEISGKTDGKEVIVQGKDEVLNTSQIAFLKDLDVNALLTIRIKYTTANSVTNEMDERDMNVEMTVVPHEEASYVGGYEEMMTYLHDKCAKVYTPEDFQRIEKMTLSFVVGQDGSVEDVNLFETSGNKEIDNIMISVLEDMPRWKPAKDITGKAVCQELQFVAGTFIGC